MSATLSISIRCSSSLSVVWLLLKIIFQMTKETTLPANWQIWCTAITCKSSQLGTTKTMTAKREGPFLRIYTKNASISDSFCVVHQNIGGFLRFAHRSKGQLGLANIGPNWFGCLVLSSVSCLLVFRNIASECSFAVLVGRQEGRKNQLLHWESRIDLFN